MWVPEILVPLSAYMVGSFLPATVIAHRRGINLREMGRNPGAGDTGRLLGVRTGVIVFVLDAAKGMIPLAVAERLGLPWWTLALTATLAVAGHNWSIYHGFWGGRGLATTTGVYAFLMPEVLVLALPPSLFAWWHTGWISTSGLVGVPLVLILSWIRRADPASRISVLVLPVLMLLRQVEWIRAHVRGRRTAPNSP